MKASLFLVVLLLTVTATAQPQQGQVELLLWNLPDNPPPNPDQAAELKVLKNFQKDNPNIEIVPGGGPQLQKFGRGTREFLLAQAGGIAPDVVGMVDEDLQIFISKNFLLPLDPYLKKAGLLEYFRNSRFSRHFQRDGKIFALPSNSIPTTYVLVYRKDLFEQAGLDPEKPPQTWEELLDYAEKLTDPSRNTYGFVVPIVVGSHGPGKFVEMVMALNGVNVIRKREDGKWIADFADDERAIQSVEFIRELLGRKIHRAGREYTGIATASRSVDDGIMLVNGEAAMIIQTMEDLPSNLARGLAIRHTGVGVLPFGPSGDGFVPILPRPVIRGFTYFGVNAACQDPERIKAALSWIEHRTSMESNKVLVETYVDWDWQQFIDPRMVDEFPV